MGSSRLPGKALVDIGGKPALEHVLDRLSQCEQDLGQIVVATTHHPADKAIEEFCRGRVTVFKGWYLDVLARFAECHALYGGDPIIRITADCPFLDPGMLDDVVGLARTGRYDYVCVDPEWVPAGWHQEAFSADALIRADREATSMHDREHVVPWMIRNVRMAQLRLIRCGGWEPTELNTEEDLVRLRAKVESVDLSHLVSRIKTVTSKPQTIHLKGFGLA